MSPPDSLTAFRRQFPQLRGKPPVIYFNHAATGLLPTSVLNASREGVKLEQPHPVDAATREKWRDIKAETRRLAADLIGAAPENIALLSSTSVALSMVSLAIPWQNGDNVITVNVENPATVVPWQNLEHLGVEVRYLSAGADDLIDVDALKSLADEKTRLIALSLVEYSTGQRLDIARIAQWARPRGILISVDGVQAVGAIPVDVKALGMNFLSFGIQKWLLGCKNIAILYADDAALQTIRSPIVTEESVADIFAEEELPTTSHPRLKLNPGALKLEALPNNNYAGIFGLRQALRNVQSFGAPVIHQRLRDLTDQLIHGLAKLDGRVISPRSDNEWSGIVSFAPAAPGDARQIVQRLREQNVYVALRKGRIRISPHFYNTPAEIRKFLALLKKAAAPAVALASRR